MGIGIYIKEIGRGKDGARSLTRLQAADLLGQVLDGAVTDLEVGAFCLAMRIKGETPEEMAGFLDATHQRLARFPDTGRPTVVLPSYNGARKLPVLTPLLALLLAREGLSVLVHGTATESQRVLSSDVLAALNIKPLTSIVSRRELYRLKLLLQAIEERRKRISPSTDLLRILRRKELKGMKKKLQCKED